MTPFSIGGTFQATAGFRDSDFFHKALKLLSRCISLSVIFHPSGFSPTHDLPMWFMRETCGGGGGERSSLKSSSWQLLK